MRVIDLITGMDISAFHSLGGWDKMLNRLKMEIAQCKGEAPTILPTVVKKPTDKDYSAAAMATNEQESMNVSEDEKTSDAQNTETHVEAMDVATSSAAAPVAHPTDSAHEEECVTCMPERVALIKSILNFLKKVIPDPTFAENIRNCKPLEHVQ